MEAPMLNMGAPGSMASVLQLLDTFAFVAHNPSSAGSPDLQERMSLVCQGVVSEVTKAVQEKQELELLRHNNRQTQKELHEARQRNQELEEGGKKTTAWLKKQLEDSQVMLASALAGKEAAENDKAQVELDNAQAKHELEELQIANRRIQSSLEASEAKVIKLQASADAGQADVTTAKAEAASWNAQAEAAQSDMAALRDTYHTSQMDLSSAQAQVAKLEREVIRLEAEHKSALEESGSSQASVADLQSAMKLATQECASLRQQGTELQGLLDQVQAQLQLAQQDVTRLKSQVKDGESALHAQERSTEEELARLQAIAREAEAKVSKAHAEFKVSLAEMHDREAVLRGELATTKEALAISQDQAIKSQTSLNDALSEVKLLQTRLLEASEDVVRLKAEVKGAQETSSQIQNSLKLVEDSLVEAKGREAALEDELRAVQEELTRLQTTLKEQPNLETSLTELQASTLALRNDLSKAQKEMGESRTAAAIARQEVERMQANLVKAHEELQRCKKTAETNEESLQASLKDTQAREQILKDDLLSVRKEVEHWKASAETASAGSEECKVALEAARAQVLFMEADVGNAKNEAGHWKAAAETASAAGKECKVALEAARAQVLLMEADVGSAQMEVAHLKMTSEAALAEARTRESSIKALLEARETAFMSELASAKQKLVDVSLAAESARVQERQTSATLLKEAQHGYEVRLQTEANKANQEFKHWQATAMALQKECAVLKEDMARLQLRSNQGQSGSQQDPKSVVIDTLIQPTRALPTRFFLIELGAWHIRAGWVDTGASSPSFEPMYFPCVVARPKNDAANLLDIVQNAGHKADRMYARFREGGVFVGRDAWYCAYDHPDPVLRGALKLEVPFVRDRLERPQDLKFLLKDVLEKMDVNLAETSLAITYKATSTDQEQADLVEMIFELDHCQDSHVRFLNEAAVLPSLGQAVTALVIDIGEDVTRVVPVFEQMVVQGGIQTAALGGADLTKYMAFMLLSLRNEAYASLVPRKMLEVARRVKEKHAYVASNFDSETEVYGCFEREKIDVMKFHRAHIATEESAVPGRRVNMSTMPESGNEPAEGGIKVGFRARLPDGQDLALTMGLERFHCGELLFRPHLYRETEEAVGLVDLVCKSLSELDQDMWPEFLQNVVVAGQTTRLPGFVDRLTTELKAHLPAEVATCLNVVPLEKPGTRPDDSLNTDPDDDEASRSLSLSSSLSSLGSYTTAVSQAAVGKAALLVTDVENWVDENVYVAKGPQLLKGPSFVCLP